jgi:hypothetical protein
VRDDIGLGKLLLQPEIVVLLGPIEIDLARPHRLERAPADKAYCQRLATTGGDPTYTELLTCLELRREARMLREKEEETTAISPRDR